jgi:hypothetical protein
LAALNFTAKPIPAHRGDEARQYWVEGGVVKKAVFLEKCLQRLVKVDIMALVSKNGKRCERWGSTSYKELKFLLNKETIGYASIRPIGLLIF